MNFIPFLLRTLPFFSVIFILMVGCSIRLGEYPVMPALFLIPIYYWLVYYPDFLSLVALLIIGLFYDALMGQELGLSSLLLMISACLGKYARPFLSPEKFPLIWCEFGLYSLSYIFLYGLFTSNHFSLFMAWLYGILLYPLVAWILSHLHLRIQAHV